MLSIARGGRGFDPGLKVLVDQSKRVCRLSLQHIVGQDFRSFCPVIECSQSECYCCVGSMRAILKSLFFMALLIVTQTSDDFPDTIQIVPAALAEQSNPAMEEAIQKAPIPHDLGNAGGTQDRCVILEPATKVRPAIAAIGSG